MARRSRVLPGVLLVIFIGALGPTQASVQAQWPISLREPSAKLPTEEPTVRPHSNVTTTSTPTLHPGATASPTPIMRSPVPTASSVDQDSDPYAVVTSSFTSTVISTTVDAVIHGAVTPAVLPSAGFNENSHPPVNTADPALLIIIQALNLGGFVLSLVILGFFIWSGLRRIGRVITNEMHTMSLATLRLQQEAERLDRREKVVFHTDDDVLSLLEQAILDAAGESVHVRLLPHGWLTSPPMMAVVDAEQTRCIFSPMPPAQVQDIARHQGLAQLLLGRATDLTAYPIDALNSTPFIADDLSGAYGYVLARHQAPRRPLPRTDRWYLYLARPRTSRWPHWFNGHVKKTGSLKRFADRLHGTLDSKPSSSTADRTSIPGD